MGREDVMIDRRFRRLRTGEGSDGLSAVSYSGSYYDLVNLPLIPPAQVNSDWNSSSGVSAILNKPTIPSGPFINAVSAGRGISVSTTSGTVTVDTQSMLMYRPNGTQVLTPKTKFYDVTTNASGVWSVTYSGDFTEVVNVSIMAISAGTTAAQARLGTIVSYSNTTATGTVVLANTIASLLGLLGLTLAGAGVTVRVKVEGV